MVRERFGWWGRLAAWGWPWALQLLALGLASAGVLQDQDQPDPEFPGVQRLTFSTFAPAAYRLAEPGDTLDRVAMYLSAVGFCLSVMGLVRSVRLEGRQYDRLWLSAIALSALSGWEAATPWPTFDGWHGLGWRVVANPSAPVFSRLMIGGLLGLLLAGLVTGAWLGRERLARGLTVRRIQRQGTLAALTLVLAVLGRVGLPSLEPEGYWSRWAIIGSLLAFNSLLIRSLPAATGRRAALSGWAGLATGTAGLIALGLHSFWLHRPIDRLREVVPGRIYICAMPTPDGLPIAHERHRFKTIINLFQEDLPGLQSPLLRQEQAFAKAHDIRYVGSPLGASTSDAFLDETLRLSQDPDAWPILVHCHACMDRTPAWWGIYQFVVEGKPLEAVMQSIEQHRGVPPKASVTLLYNRVLEPRATERYRSDPTATLLRRSAEGVEDPYYDQLAEERAGARTSEPATASNPGEPRR